MLNFEVIPYKQRLDLLQVVKMGLADGMTLETFHDRLEAAANADRKKLQLEASIKQRQAKKRKTLLLLCPVCGEPSIELQPVNVSKCTIVPGGYRTAIQCRSDGCMFTEYSRLDAAEVAQIFIAEGKTKEGKR